MRFVRYLLLFTLIHACILPTTHAAEPEPVGKLPDSGPLKLFDGKSLNGLYTWLKDTKREDPRKVFTVEDGVLHISGDGWGCVTTEKPYENYHLVLEFKWGDKAWHERTSAARDSGLLISSNGADGGYQGIWMPSIEVQIIEGGVGDFILVNGPDKEGNPVPISLSTNVKKDRDGELVWSEDGEKQTFNAKNRRRINWFGRDPDWKDELGFRGKNDVESPHGEWNRLDVLVQDGHVQVFVNGVKVNEAFDIEPRQGKLQVQSELAELFVRRWELWPVGKGPKPAPPEKE